MEVLLVLAAGSVELSCSVRLRPRLGLGMEDVRLTMTRQPKVTLLTVRQLVQMEPPLLGLGLHIKARSQLRLLWTTG